MRTIEQGNSLFTNIALTDDGDVWWEGMENTPAAPDVVEEEGLDAGLRGGRRPPQLPLLHADRPVPRARARVGRPEGRADLGDLLRRPPQGRRSRWSPSRGTGSTAPSWARRCRARRPRRPPAGSARCAATRWPCCRSSATTSATTSSTGSTSARAPTRRSCRRSSTSTGSAAATTAGSCGPASARTAGCSSGPSSASRARPLRRRRRSGYVPTADEIDLDGLDVDRADVDEALAVEPPRVARRDPAHRGVVRPDRASLPTSMRDELDALKHRLGM